MEKSHCRLSRGLRQRLLLFRPNHSPSATLSSTVGSKALSLAEQAFNAVEQANLPPDHAILTLSLGLQLRAEVDQRAYFAKFPDKQHFRIIRRLVLGPAFAGAEAEDLPLDSMNDIDFSLLSTADFCDAIAAEQELFAVATDLLSRAYADIGFIEPSSCAELAHSLALFGVNSTFYSIEDVGAAFYILKQRFWPLFGTDLLIYVYNLTQPSFMFDQDQLRRMHSLAAFWGLGSISAQLIILRALNQYNTEKAYFDKDPRSLLQAAHLPLSLTKGIEFGHVGNFLPSKDPIQSAIIFSLRFNGLLRRGSANQVLATVRHQWESDHSVFDFLDWEYFRRKMPPVWGDNYLTNLIVGLTLLKPVAAQRFEGVALSYGRGFVSNQLIVFATALKSRGRGMYQFAKSISALPPKTRRMVAEEVTQKGMLERYYFSFGERMVLPQPKRGRRKSIVSAADLEVCNARIRLSLLLEGTGALGPVSAAKILAEESAFRKMYRFREVFRNGRIRIDWSYLSGELSSTIEEDFGRFFSGGVSFPQVLGEVISEIVAERMADLMLFESATSLEGALSNNLRHGIIVPRFLRAFSDASNASAIFRGISTASNKSAFATQFPRMGEKIFEFEETVSSEIESFQEHWLRIASKGPFQMSLARQISERLREHMKRKPKGGVGKTVKDIIEDYERLVRSVLEDARLTLTQKVKPKIDIMMSELSGKVRSAEDTGAVGYLDGLAVSLEQAVEEVSNWLSLVDYEQSQSASFEIGALIEEEAFTFGVSEKSKQRIKCEMYYGEGKRRLRTLQLSGSSFELFDQVIHNSISNARKSSGLGYDTDVLFRIYIDDRDIKVVVKNNYDPACFSEMVSHQRRAKTLVTADKKSSSRSRTRINEGGSGFKKVIAAAEKVLGHRAAISFTPLSKEEPSFTVQIVLPLASEKVIYETSSSHRG